MPSVFDTVTGLLAQGDRADRLAGVMGTDNKAVDAVHRAGTPAILNGLAARLAQPEGTRSVLDLLDGDRDSALAHVDRFIDEGDPRLGNGILNSISGGHPADLIDLTDRMAGPAGIDPGTAGRLLPMLAPLVVGALAWARSSEGLDAAGLAGLLETERADLESRGLLGPLPAPAPALVGATAVGATALGATALGATALAGEAWAGTGVDAAGGRAAIAGLAAGSAATGRAAGRNGNGAAATPGATERRAPGLLWFWWALVGVAVIALAAIGLARCGGDVDSGTPVSTGGAASTAPAAVAVATTPATAPTTQAPPATPTPTTATPTTATPTTATPASSTTATSAAPGTTVAPAPTSGATINDLLSLAPVTFDTASARITADGQKVLDQAATYLTAYPAIRVEIGGHTDNDGAAAYNLKLSQSRADAVKAYLVARGIDAGRMSTKGYGATAPKVANDSPANKAVNRRIEFTIQ